MRDLNNLISSSLLKAENAMLRYNGRVKKEILNFCEKNNLDAESIISNNNKPNKCLNCGMQSKLKDFVDGCSYCGTYYNIDYTNKDLGSKYHYDRVLRNSSYRIITGIVDLIISMILCFFFKG